MRSVGQGLGSGGRGLSQRPLVRLPASGEPWAPQPLQDVQLITRLRQASDKSQRRLVPVPAEPLALLGTQPLGVFCPRALTPSPPRARRAQSPSAAPVNRPAVTRAVMPGHSFQPNLSLAG